MTGTKREGGERRWLALVSFLTVPSAPPLQVPHAGRLHAPAGCTADLTANLAELISGIRVTQAYSREEQNQEQFDEINELSQQVSMFAVRVWATFSRRLRWSGPSG